MVPTFKLLIGMAQGGKMGLMLIEKLKKKKNWKRANCIISQFYLTSTGSYIYPKKNIIHSYNTDTASVLTKNQKKKKVFNLNNFEIWNSICFNSQIEKLKQLTASIFSDFNIFDKIGPKYQNAIFSNVKSLGNLLRINFKVVLKILI